MQFSPRRVLADVWVGATGAEIHLRLAGLTHVVVAQPPAWIMGKGNCTNVCTEDHIGVLLLNILYFHYCDCNYDFYQSKYTEYENQVIAGIK